MALSWGYREHAHQPYWGPVTAQFDFCEENYILTTYVAELINTLTNLTYLYYACYGIVSNSNRKDAVLRNLPYMGIACVGLGSAIFHATMKNYTQWCDDLSMLIATATVIHRVFTFDKSLTVTVISGLAITAVMIVFSTWHCITDETVMHSVLFGIMIAVVGIKTRSIIGNRVADPAVCKEVKKMATWGGVIFVTGFLIWNIDTAVCSSLTTFKRSIGMPWSFVFELHGWWHVFTGAGAYIFIALVEYLTSEEAGQPLAGRFAWPVGLIVDGNAGEILGGGCVNGKASNGKASNGKAPIGAVSGRVNRHANGRLEGTATDGLLIEKEKGDCAAANGNTYGYSNGRVNEKPNAKCS